MDTQTLDVLLTVIHDCDAVQLCTNGLAQYPETRYITNVLNRTTRDLNLHFITTVGSPKYQQLTKNPYCCLYYFNPENRHTVSVFGRIKIWTDPNIQEQFWQPGFTAFGFTGSNDPTFSVLEFTPDEYKYYISGKLYSGKIN